MLQIVDKRRRAFFACACLSLALGAVASGNAQHMPLTDIAGDLQVCQLTDHVYLHVAHVESSTLGRYSCNGAVLVNGDEALLFDTPTTIPQTQRLVQWLHDSLHVTVVGFVPNHWHDDCMGGLAYVQQQNIPSYANEMTRQIAESKGLPVPGHGFRDSLVLALGDVKAVCRYFGGGHSADNIVVWFPSDKVLFAGCMAKPMAATSLGNISDAVLPAWPATLHAVLESFPTALIVIPGHGDPGTPDLLRHTIDLLRVSASPPKSQ